MISIKQKIDRIDNSIPGLDIKPGNLFENSSGNVYIRVKDGAIELETDDLVPYTEEEMKDCNEYAQQFESCRLLKGKVKIIINND